MRASFYLILNKISLCKNFVLKPRYIILNNLLNELLIFIDILLIFLTWAIALHLEVLKTPFFTALINILDLIHLLGAHERTLHKWAFPKYCQFLVSVRIFKTINIFTICKNSTFKMYIDSPKHLSRLIYTLTYFKYIKYSTDVNLDIWGHHGK